MRIIRMPDVERKTGYSAIHIYRLERQGDFPQKIKLGKGPTGAVGWFEDDVDAWLEQKAKASEDAK